MYLGFLTVSLGKMPLKEKARWASQVGFNALEVACWPNENDRDYSSCDIDVDNLTQEQAEEIKEYFSEYGLKISSLAYYDNNLDKDPVRRAFINNHTKKVIDAAVMLGTPLVGTFVGRNSEKNMEENFNEFETVFTDLVAYAEEKGIRLMIENCDMRGWQTPGLPGTISYTPELWEEMFKRVPSKSFGLNFDPSHLIPQFIDYLKAAEAFSDRIFHMHAKDAEVYYDRLNKYGINDRQLKGSGEDNYGYWRYRMPSLGQVDWEKLVSLLKAKGYDGTISTEHEDPLYEGSEEKVKEGLVIGLRHLEKFI
jgi:sugar phosphate isomerase/epimerase